MPVALQNHTLEELESFDEDPVELKVKTPGTEAGMERAVEN